jgi:2-succinyl-5-enolpyruvyl-6-hydroxy-3-cyclohexene-1-carboxylate synthase
MNLAMREPLVPAGDGFAGDLAGRHDDRPWTSVASAVPVADDADIQVLAEALSVAARPLLVAGEGSFDADAIVRFASQRAMPLFAEPLSNARRGDTAITAYDALLRTGWAAHHRPDLVIRIGRIATSKVLARALDGDVHQILIDPDRWWLDPGRSAAQMIGADVGDTLTRAGATIDETPSDWLDVWLDAERAARKALDDALDGDERATEPRVARDLAALAPDGSNLVVASSMPVRDLDWFMDARSGIRIYGNRGASGIDGFVSTAVGIGLATGKPTYALAGDLSMLHDQNGLLGASERGVDLTFVVLNNDGGGIFSFLPQAEFPSHFETLFGTPHGIDFERLAGVYGLGYRYLDRAADLAGAIEGEGIRVVEVRTDRDENVAIHRRAWAAVETAVSSLPGGS